MGEEELDMHRYESENGRHKPKAAPKMQIQNEPENGQCKPKANPRTRTQKTIQVLICIVVGFIVLSVLLGKPMNTILKGVGNAMEQTQKMFFGFIL